MKKKHIILTVAFSVVIALSILLICVYEFYTYARAHQPEPFDFLGSKWVSEDGSMTIKINSIPGFKSMSEVDDFIDSFKATEDETEILNTLEEFYNTGSVVYRTNEGEKEYPFCQSPYNTARCNGEFWHFIWGTEDYCIYDTAYDGRVRFTRTD